jgi:hypothetical protein
MGHCPALPAAQLALALLAARIRTALAQAGAIFRLHPAGIMVPVMMASGGVIAFLVLSSVSVQVHGGPRAPGPPPALGAPAPAVSGGVAGPSPGQVPGTARPGGGRGQVAADRSRPPAPPGPTAPPSGQPGPGTGDRPSPGPTASATAEPAGAAPPERSPGPGPEGRPSQSPATAVFWLSAPLEGDMGDGSCLNPGQLGICPGS